MAKCYIKCGSRRTTIMSAQSQTGSLQTGMKIYSDISDAEVENHIRIFSDVVVVKAGNIEGAI